MKSKSKTPYNLLLQIVKEKHTQIPKIMKELDIQCWIVFIRETATNSDSVQNLVIAGDVVWESAFVFYMDKDQFRKIAIVGNFDADAELIKGIWNKVIPYKEGISSVLIDVINDIKPSGIHLNFSENDVIADGLSHGMFLKISKILEKYTLSSAEILIQKLRSVKTKTEIKLIREACELTETINYKLHKKFASGMSEIDIQQMYFQEMDNLGVMEAWQRESCPAIDAGPDKVMGHIGPSDLLIKRGHTLHNDFGVQLNGYCSDLQRMWFFGNKEDIPEELIHAFDTVHGAITKASEFIKKGVKGYEVDKIAREFVISRGYDEYAHALGHQVGTKAHDGGTLLGPHWERYGNLPDGIIEVGNVFTLELYVKTKNYGMVSLEEDIVITEKGCEFLVPRQNKWICLNK